MWFYGRSSSTLAASPSTQTSETVGGHVSVRFPASFDEPFIIFPLPLQNIRTFLQHSSQASPAQKHFITLLLLTLLQFVFNKTDCIKGAMHQCWLSLITRCKYSKALQVALFDVNCQLPHLFSILNRTVMLPALSTALSSSLSDQSEAAAIQRQLLSAQSFTSHTNWIVKQL